jgi:hypothetical protein
MVIKCTYKDDLFKLDNNTITSDDIVFELTSDVNMECFILVTFHDKGQKTIQLTKTNTGIYRGRLKLYEQELHLLVEDAKVNLCIYTTIQSLISNQDTIKFNLPTIHNLIKLNSNTEILQLKKELKNLKDTLWKMSTSKGVTGLPKLDTSYAEPGMIPVLATKDGAFILKHPFANAVESINNIYPEQGNVTITADNIAIQDKVLSDYLAMVVTAMAQQKSYIDNLKELIKDLNQEINNLKLQLQAHISNPII